MRHAKRDAKPASQTDHPGTDTPLSGPPGSGTPASDPPASGGRHGAPASDQPHSTAPQGGSHASHPPTGEHGNAKAHDEPHPDATDARGGRHGTSTPTGDQDDAKAPDERHSHDAGAQGGRHGSSRATGEQGDAEARDERHSEDAGGRDGPAADEGEKRAGDTGTKARDERHADDTGARGGRLGSSRATGEQGDAEARGERHSEGAGGRDGAAVGEGEKRGGDAGTAEFPAVGAGAGAGEGDSGPPAPGGVVRRVLAVARFEVAVYVRSGQVLFPLVLLGLIIAVQSGMPANPASSFADAAAFALPVFALATHQLLGAEPDTQRAISVRNAGSRQAYLVAGLLAALAVNLVFLLLSTASALRGPLAGHALVGGSVVTTILVGLAVHVLTYLPGVALGALTTRTVTGDAPAEYVALACGLLIAVVPGLASGPGGWIALPLFRLLRAANAHRLELAAPGIALHVAIWTAVVTAAYVFLRLRRRSA